MEFLTPSDAARLLTELGYPLTPSGVKWHSDAGHLPVERTIGGNRLFLRADIERFAEIRGSAKRKAG